MAGAFDFQKFYTFSDLFSMFLIYHLWLKIFEVLINTLLFEDVSICYATSHYILTH